MATNRYAEARARLKQAAQRERGELSPSVSKQSTTGATASGAGRYAQARERLRSAANAERARTAAASASVSLPKWTDVSAQWQSGHEAAQERTSGTMGAGRYNFSGGRETAKQQEFDPLEFAAGITAKGVTSAAKNVSGTLSFLEGALMKPAGDLMGAEDLYKTGMFYRLNQDIKQEQEAAQQRFQPNVDAGGTAAKVADFLGTTTIAAIPQAVVAFATGGGEKGLDVLSKAQQVAPGVLTSVKSVAESLPKTPVFWSSFLQTIGNDYEDAKADGMGDGAATLYALADGVANAGIEIGGGIETLPNALQGSRFTLKQWVKTMVEEGNEEVAQGIIQRGLQNLIYGKDNALYSTQDENAILNPVTAAQEWGGGAFAGGVLGGAQGLTANLLNDHYTRMRNEVESSEGFLQQSADSGIDNAYASMLENGMFSREAEQARVSANELLEEAARQTVAGNKVSNRMAERVLMDKQAMEVLGVEVSSEQSKAQQRAVVKSAVEALARSVNVANTEAGEIARTGPGVEQKTVQTVENRVQVAERQADQTTAQQVYNIQSVKRAAKSLGKQGERIAADFYDGSTDAAAYYGAFSAYYQAGVSGLDMGKVETMYADVLNSVQQKAAYLAGQNDAAASLAAEKERVQYATVYGDEAGLIRNDYVAKLPKETAALYNRVGRAVGVKIELVDSIRGGVANGVFLQGKNTIQLAMDAENPLNVVAAHEITHRLQTLAPEAYRQYRNYAVQYLAERTGEVAGTDGLVNAKLMEYADHGTNLTTEEAMDEIAADFTQKLIENKDLFGELAKQNRSVARKLLDAIKEFISKVKSAFRGNVAAQDQAAFSEYGVDMKTLEEAARLWTEAYNAAATQAKTAQKNTAQEGGMVRYALKEYDEHQVKNWENSKNILVYKDQLQLRRFIQNAIDGHNLEKKMYFGSIPLDLAARIKAETGLDVKGYNCTLRASEIRKILKGHGTETTEAKRGQRAITTKDFLNIPEVIQSPDSISLSDMLFEGKPVILFSKELNGRTTVVSYVSQKHMDLTVQTMYAGKSQGNLANAADAKAPAITPEAHAGTVPYDNSVSQDGEKNKTRFSLKTDSEGRKLTEEQREFFKDSKARDADGNLLVLYHGTNAEFTKFAVGDVGYHLGTKEQAERRIRNNGRLMRLYANIQHPLEIEADYGDWGGNHLANMFLDNDYFEDRKISKRFEEILSIDRAKKGKSVSQQKDDAVRDLLQSMGYDGIRYNNQFEGKGYSYIAFSPEQIKSADNKTPTSDPDIRYSLKPVTPVQPTSDDWKPGASFDEVKAAHPTLFALDADEADTRNPTQITGTVKSYRKIYDTLQAEGFDGSILDASSGLGYGTRAGREEYSFNVDDIEPFPDAKYTPMFMDYSALDKTYDVVINNAVLNVMPQDLRDALVVKMGQLLNPGGRAYINVRGTDVKNASSKVSINDDLMEYFISNTGSYQKGFTSKELVAYLKDALGDGFTVNPTNKFGGVSAIVTKGGRNSLKGSGNIQRDMLALAAENDLLRERVDFWKGQLKRTRHVTTDKKAVVKAARELIRSYGADLAADDIAGDMQSLYDYIASGTSGKDELTYTEARRRAEVIAEKLVGNAIAVDDEGYRQYSDLRAYLRDTKLTLSQGDSQDIPDYADFRKRNFGRLNLGNGGTNIDQVYKEMSEMWPEFFDEQRESHPVDQLLHIAQVLDGIYDVTEYNPFSRYLDQAVAGAANEIMEKFFDLPQTRDTFADRQARKLDDAKANGRQQVQQVREQKDARMEELRKQNQQRVQDAIAKERSRREKQIETLKSNYRERDAAGRERRSARELRAKIVRHASVLSQKLLRPSDKQHIPESLRTATTAVLDAINLESVYAVDPATGKRNKNKGGLPTKRTEAFRKLRLAYAEMTKEGGDYTLIIDPDLMDNLNELEAMRDTPLAAMSTDQLVTVWATLKAVEASIRTANTMLGASRFETISQFADGIKNDNILRADRGNYKGFLGKMDKLTNLDMQTPQAYFHRMGSTGEELFRMLRTAQDRHISIMREAQQATEKVVGKVDINKLERETHTFDVLGGEKLTMSTAQIMSLYELMKRKQAQDHILKGGIRPEAIDIRRSLRENRRSAPAHVGIDNLATITDVLTDEQIEMADALQKYMGGALAELGNEASMEVYGYRKFNEPDYFPIQVDKNQTKNDIAKEAQASTIAGRGFTKSVAPKANNAVMVNSIFDVYSSHVNDMATYAAWLSTMENVRRIRDFTFRDGEGTRVGDVKTIIERVFGKHGNEYLNKLVDDINQGVRTDRTGNLMDGIVGNYKAAAVAANIRVILQQPTAILRALDTLDLKYLLQGTVKRGDWEKVKKYAPIAVWKDWGYFDINTGRQMKDVLLNSDTRLERVRQAGMALAGKADSFAWARLWNAVEAETKDTRPGLKPGTDAFYQAVAKRFSTIIDRTQVVDGLLQRSQIMRSPDALTKMSTSFMAEPTKTYNMFTNAVYDLRQASGTAERSKAKKALARTSFALVTSFAVNAVMQAIVDGLRDDDKEKDYWEKVLQAYIGFSGDEETFADYWNSFWDGNLEANFNPLSYLPYLKDVASIIRGYDVTRMDMEAIEKVWTAANNMKKALTGEGKFTLSGASANLMAEAARLLGLPVANLKRDIQGTITTAAIETDNYLLQYRIDRALLNMGYQGNTSNFMDILYNASINDPEAYEIIYADMVKRGITEERIRNSMESRMKRDQGAKSVGELTRRYLTPAQEKAYSGMYNRVTESNVWNSASAEQRTGLETDLYNLAAGNDAGMKLQEKAEGGAVYGLNETDYLLYLAAREMVDEKNKDVEKRNGSIDQGEAEAAIDMLVGLSEDARAYLWQSTNKGWKESSNPFK